MKKISKKIPPTYLKVSGIFRKIPLYQVSSGETDKFPENWGVDRGTYQSYRKKK